MNKKIMSTVLLFIVGVGFMWWGLAMLFTPHNDGETTIYSLLILGCSGYAFFLLLQLPRRKEP